MQENQRVRLTKMLLQNSLIELMKSKHIYKISIKEICDNAGVNRSTFYKHYDTEFDLLKDVESKYLQTISDNISVAEKESTLLRLLEYVIDNIDVFQLFLEETPGNNFFERLITMSFEKMRYDQQLIRAESKYSQEYLYRFIVYGALSVVKSWIEKYPRETPMEMTNILSEFVGKFVQ